MRAIVLCLLLTACGADTASQTPPQTIRVPVATGCLVGTRPAPVEPLSAQFTADEWAGLSHKQKTELVAAQALKRMNRETEIDAATGACK